MILKENNFYKHIIILFYFFFKPVFFKPVATLYKVELIRKVTLL